MPPPPSASRYVRVVTAAGLVAFALLVVLHPSGPVVGSSLAFWALATAVLAGELLPIKLGGSQGEVAPSSTFTFALLLGYGPAAAVTVQVVACVIAAIAHRVPADRTAFNVAQYALGIAASSLVLLVASGSAVDEPFDLPGLALACVAAAVFFGVNTTLVAGVIALHSGGRFGPQLRSDLSLQTGTEGILLGLAPLALLATERNVALLALLGLPLVAVQRAGRQAVLNERLALHDDLTGLPNRTLFLERTRQAISAAQRSPRTVALMLLDLDGFKEVNDTLGHHQGDEVLRVTAGRLAAVLRAPDTIARLGGDEFAVLLPTAADPLEAEAVARRLIDALVEPVDIAGVAVEVSASIGIACHPDDGADEEVLLQRADVAMYQAKEARDGVRRYAPEEDEYSLMRLTLAGGLRHGLEHDELEIHYQPLVEPAGRRMVGVEALVRWRHPRHGLMAPDDFIPMAERTGLVLPLTEHVLSAALRQVKRWREEGLYLTVSVNLSARVLVDPGLPDTIASLCRQHGLDPGVLVCEITESMVAADPARSIPVAERIVALGAALSIDDFGTGFSSLEYLKRLPTAEVKVDRSFVAGVTSDHRDAAIVASTISLAHSLGLRVVAEGVEDDATYDAVSGLGADLVQGYLLSRPVPADEIAGVARSLRIPESLPMS